MNLLCLALAEARRLGFSEGRSGLGNAFPRLQAAEAEGHFIYYFIAVKAIFLCSTFLKLTGNVY